ncbi:MAG: DNA mismatch repair protein MutL, partial [Bradymonadaceae bacterium]
GRPAYEFERNRLTFPVHDRRGRIVAHVGRSVPDEDGRAAYFSTLRVIGQFRRAYILCEDASGMVIIDQHAAHERIGFERLRHLYAREHKETQPLLFPMRMELDALRADCLEEHLEFFLDAGFEIEPFGGQTFVLKSVPAVLQKAPHERLIKDAIDDLSNLGRSDRVEEAMEVVLSRMACHSVVRGPTPLSTQECESLLEQMDEIDFRANCPHGRPVYYRIPLLELEEAFGRR